MLKECLEVFEDNLKKMGEALILDSYVLADGTYILIGRDGQQKGMMEVHLDKKTKNVDRSHLLFSLFCFYDYHSQLISMNKPMEPKKIIHSNNYLSFFVKKDSIVSGKLTEEIIDGYYAVLNDPVNQKYKKSKEAVTIYDLFVREEGEVDQKQVEEKKNWIKEHIFSLQGVDWEKKDYLKLFFEADKSEYEREGRRYFLPNIYNCNDYNIEIEQVVYGLPDNNLGMNAKKPFLSIKSRKYPASYLLDGEQVLLQKKFFDYLMNLVSAGFYHIYVDTVRKKIHGCRTGEVPNDMEAGYYLRLKKGKTEAEILEQDNISGYKKELASAFDFQEFIQGQSEKRQGSYKRYYHRTDVGGLINEVFFSNYLAGNYMTDAGAISITDETLKQNLILARNAIFDWTYKGIDRGFGKLLQKVSLDLIKGTLLNGYQERAIWQLNLRLSFRKYFSPEEGKNMAENISALKASMERKVYADTLIPLENDREYYYAVGQLVAYLLSLNKAKDKNHALLNPFLNAKTDGMIKKRLLQIYKKYNYNIPDYYKRIKNLLGMVEGYEPDGSVDQEMIILGYVSDSVIYIKSESKEEKTNE